MRPRFRELQQLRPNVLSPYIVLAILAFAVALPPAIATDNKAPQEWIATWMTANLDLSNQEMLYREPMTKVENADVEFAAGQPVHFCPGSIGGAEWNGPA